MEEKKVSINFSKKAFLRLNCDSRKPASPIGARTPSRFCNRLYQNDALTDWAKVPKRFSTWVIATIQLMLTTLLSRFVIDSNKYLHGLHITV